MAKKINIKGPIIPNDYKWFYEWFEMDSTCPNDVEKIINEAKGDPIEVFINSPGGIIDAGTEVYTMLKGYNGDVKIYIVGEACSAASIIAMARHCAMAPTALMMMHCVSSGARGNHTALEHTAGVLRTADDALANAYIIKSGMTKEMVLDMMEKETWLTAKQAKEKGLIDEIMFEEKKPTRLVASSFALPSEEQMAKVKEMIKKQTAIEVNPEEGDNGDESVFLVQKAKAKLNLIKLKGGNL